MPPPEPLRPIAGWDIGGAHVKLALWEQGRIDAVVQRPCPLWQGMEHLDSALDDLLCAYPSAAQAEHAITMTGEMTDLFCDRRDGVTRLASRLRERLGPRVRFYAGDSPWCTLPDASARWREIASANWRASAALVAANVDEALFIDVGSTTTDLVPIAHGRLLARGENDASRLMRRELVYQGVVRTPLCALARRIAFRGREFNVMNEWFATTADVYRLSGELAPEHDQHPAADHADKSERATCSRLARMIGHDAADATPDEWRAFANAWRTEQLREIECNVEQVLAAAALSPRAVIVGAGCGDFLARALASLAGRRYVAFDALLPVSAAHADWARVCAPSVALAWLLAREHAPCGS